MRTVWRVTVTDEALRAGLAEIRRSVGVPTDFPRRVTEEAETVAGRGPAPPPEAPSERRDARDVALIAVDPAGSRDLDQAFAATAVPGGYRVHYAIADIAAFVAPDGAIAAEATSRGVTLYGPDQRAPLHPEILSEAAASLLPGQDRPALLWTIELDGDGQETAATIERATVRVQQALSYAQAHAALESGDPDPPIALLREIGELRLRLERERGAVSLNLPAQELIAEPAGGYTLRYDETLPVEQWNAQISLLTGIVAAELMLDAGIGLLRTLPEPDAATLADLRRSAAALGVQWPTDLPYPAWVRTLDSTDPTDAALMIRAARTLGGAGYTAFTAPAELPPDHGHAAIAANYAHVTAPLRRICDRYANEILLAICADRTPPDWAAAELDELPSIMGRARQRERAYDRQVVDFAELLVLDHYVGETVSGMVVSVRNGRPVVQLRQPAVITEIEETALEPGSEVTMTLLACDPVTGSCEWRIEP